VGDDAGWEVVRVLASVPRFGVDFDDGNYPQEAALETKAVSFDKGCYLGQEVVCMLEMRGHVKKKLVSLAIDGSESPPAHTPVEDGKGSVGEVTTAVRAPDGSVHALAMVKYAVTARGTELVVGGHPARVV
jgi:folate-binding protein YgfZ